MRSFATNFRHVLVVIFNQRGYAASNPAEKTLKAKILWFDSRPASLDREWRFPERLLSARRTALQRRSLGTEAREILSRRRGCLRLAADIVLIEGQ
jgi:hypothetical protein